MGVSLTETEEGIQMSGTEDTPPRPSPSKVRGLPSVDGGTEGGSVGVAADFPGDGRRIGSGEGLAGVTAIQTGQTQSIWMDNISH